MSPLRTRVLALAAALLATAPAHAALVTSGSVGGAPAGAVLENFDGLALGTAGGMTPSGIAVSFGGTAQAVQGAVSGRYARPFLSGNNGTGFGPGGTIQADGADATTYLSSGSTAANTGSFVELLLPGARTYFGLLWGSIDSYNTLSFYDGATLIGSLTGTDVVAGPNGNQGVNGTLYVNITSDVAFNRVVATASNFAFEFDNVAIDRGFDIQVPAAGMAGILALGAAGVMLRRRRA